MSKFLTEGEVREFARDEWRRLREIEQARCSHTRSATLSDDGPVCDQCGKLIMPDENGTFDFSSNGGELSQLERKHVSYGKERS